MNDASPAEAEATVYPELAKANLARMRGDYKQAEDQLLSVLKRYPNNPSANEMLGDLAAEREDWPQAVQWYELALEIVPTSASIARKIKDARARIDRKDTQATTVQLGLPDPSSKTPIMIAAGIILLLAAFAGVYYLGSRQTATAAVRTPPQIITAQPSSGSGAEPQPQTDQERPALPMTTEEEALMSALRSNAEDGAAVTSVELDPRAGSVRITFTTQALEARAKAARLARAAFAHGTSFGIVTLRGVTDGAVAYMADVDRTRMSETQDPAWQQAQGSPDEWINYVLTNEWPRTAPPPTTNIQPSQTPPVETPGSTGGPATSGGQ